VDRVVELTKDSLDLSSDELGALWEKHAPKIRKLRRTVADIEKSEQILKKREGANGKAITKLKVELTTISTTHLQSRRKLSDKIKRRSDAIAQTKLQLKAATQAKSKKQLKLKKHEHVLNRVCALARNSYAATHLKRDFKSGIDDLSNAMVQSSQSSPTSSLTDLIPELPVFTVSSRDFRDLTQLGPTGATTWYTANDTGIPKLRHFVRSTLERNRMHSESVRAREIVLFLESLTQYLRIEIFPSAPERADLTKVGQIHMALLQDHCEEKTHFLMDQLTKILLCDDGQFAKSLRRGQIAAEAAALRQIQREESRLHWASYRATVNRHGEYVSPTAGPINLNEALARPVLDGAAMEWSSVFSKGVTEFTSRWIQAMEQIARRSLTLLSKALEEKSTSSGSTLVAPLRGEMGQVALRGFSLQLKELVAEFENDITTVQRDASRSIQTHVKECMHNGYTRGGSESGTGCVARLKEHVRKAAQIERHRMFRSALSNVFAKFKVMIKRLTTMGISGLKRHCNVLLRDVAVVWESSCECTVDEKERLLREIAPLIESSRSLELCSIALNQSIDQQTNKVMLPALGNEAAASFDANTVRAIMGIHEFPQGTSAINNIEFTSGRGTLRQLDTEDRAAEEASKRQRREVTPNAVCSLYESGVLSHGDFDAQMSFVPHYDPCLDDDSSSDDTTFNELINFNWKRSI
jgi:hypothetical protein